MVKLNVLLKKIKRLLNVKRMIKNIVSLCCRTHPERDFGCPITKLYVLYLNNDACKTFEDVDSMKYYIEKYMDFNSVFACKLYITYCYKYGID